MALISNNVTIVTPPIPDTNSRGSRLVSDGAGGSFWGYLGNPNTVIDSNAWRYRSIYTHGYLAAGYKGYNPWRTVNKTWHSTDTTVYCGEQISTPAGYTKGVYSDYNAYIVTNGWNVAGTRVSSYNLFNGSIRMFSADGFSSTGVPYGYSGNNPYSDGQGVEYGTAGYGGDVGGMALSVSICDPSCANDIKGQHGWITGGGSTTTNRLHFPTEVMYSGWASPSSGVGDGASGELYGWFSWSSTYAYVTWSTSTWSSTGTWGGWGKDYQCKILSTKWGHHYIGTGDNVTTGKAKFSDSTGSTISTFSKVRAYGEENCESGQDWGYMLGHYDGQQNNHTIKQSHSTDVEVTLGSNAQPKGHYGQSSGACSSAAATIVAGSIIN